MRPIPFPDPGSPASAAPESSSIKTASCPRNPGSDSPNSNFIPTRTSPFSTSWRRQTRATTPCSFSLSRAACRMALQCGVGLEDGYFGRPRILRRSGAKRAPSTIVLIAITAAGGSGTALGDVVCWNVLSTSEIAA